MSTSSWNDIGNHWGLRKDLLCEFPSATACWVAKATGWLSLDQRNLAEYTRLADRSCGCRRWNVQRPWCGLVQWIPKFGVPGTKPWNVRKGARVNLVFVELCGCGYVGRVNCSKRLSLMTRLIVTLHSPCCSRNEVVWCMHQTYSGVSPNRCSCWWHLISCWGKIWPLLR